MLADRLPGWATGQRKERNPVCEVSSVDRDLYECKKTGVIFSKFIRFFIFVRKV